MESNVYKKIYFLLISHWRLGTLVEMVVRWQIMRVGGGGLVNKIWVGQRIIYEN